jgi:predicted NBD/HSP70 family sugar kinase
VIEEVGEKLSITISTLSSILDPALVIIAGGITEFSAPLLPIIRKRLVELTINPPELKNSTLGSDVVVVGAVHRAIDHIRASARN